MDGILNRESAVEAAAGTRPEIMLRPPRPTTFVPLCRDNIVSWFPLLNCLFSERGIFDSTRQINALISSLTSDAVPIAEDLLFGPMRPRCCNLLKEVEKIMVYRLYADSFAQSFSIQRGNPIRWLETVKSILPEPRNQLIFCSIFHAGLKASTQRYLRWRCADQPLEFQAFIATALEQLPQQLIDELLQPHLPVFLRHPS